MTMRPGQAKGPSTSNGSAGGGGSGLTGTLTAGTVPIASAAHTLVDSLLTYASNTFKFLLSFAGGPITWQVENSNAAANSDARIFAKTGSAGSNAYNQWTSNGHTGRMGVSEANGWIGIADNGGSIDAPDLQIKDTGIKANRPLTIGTTSLVTPAALTSVSNAVALDADLADLFTLTLTENTTVAAPTNPRTGRRFMLRIRQDGTGGRTCAFNAAFRFVSGVAPTIAANTAEVTYLGFIWNETDSKWDAVGGPTQPFQ